MRGTHPLSTLYLLKRIEGSVSPKVDPSRRSGFFVESFLGFRESPT